MNHPAPISSITESAICPITRILPAPILALLPVIPRPASFKVPLTLTGRGSPGGRQAKDQAGEQRNADGEREHPQIRPRIQHHRAGPVADQATSNFTP